MQKLFNRHQGKVRFLYVSLLVLAVAITIPDLILYYGALENKIGLKLTDLHWGILAAVSALRLITGVSIGQRIYKHLLFWILPGAAGILFACRVVEEQTHINFVYTYFHIYIPTLAAVGYFPLLYALVLLDIRVIKENWKQAIFTAAALLLFTFGYIKEHQYLFFERLDTEDGWVEYLHAALFFTASWIAYSSLKLVQKSRVKGFLKTFWMTGLFISTFLFFLIGLEELSWGQRLFGLSTPEGFKEANLQDEINIHNIRVVFRYVYYAYFAVGAYGMLSWLLEYIPGSFKGINLSTYIRPFISRWYVSPYFLVISSYVLWRLNAKSKAYDIWEETAELFLALGIVIMYYRSKIFIKGYLEKRSSK